MPSLVHTVKSQGGFFYVANDGTYCRARQKIKHEDGHSFFAPSHWPMVPAEIWSCTLAYNLIRLKILQTCVLTEHTPRTTSFTSTMQMLATKWVLAAVILTEELIELGMQTPTSQRTGHRPDRVEPRVNKRRPKLIALMKKPRQILVQELIAAA